MPGVDDQHGGTGVLKDEMDLGRRQPGVDGHQDTPGQRHCEVGDEHLGDVGQQIRHPVTGADAGGLQRVGDARHGTLSDALTAR